MKKKLAIGTLALGMIGLNAAPAMAWDMWNPFTQSPGTYLCDTWWPALCGR